jgi:hypothetical protein
LIEVGLSLFGEEAGRIIELLGALEQIEQISFARNEGRVRLHQIHQHLANGASRFIYHQKLVQPPLPGESPNIPKAPECVKIKLITPLRIVKSGQSLNAENFTGRDFIDAVEKRFLLLESGEASLNALKNRAEYDLSFDQYQMRTYRLERSSRRRRQSLNLDGVLGSFRLAGPDLSKWWPLLWYGQYLNLGKGTVMGLGQYQILMSYASG